VLVFACVDVAYTPISSRAACVIFNEWTDAAPAREVVLDLPAAADYEPGEFYKRELPCLLAVLSSLAQQPDTVIIDGYVWVSSDRLPGLGAHLYRSLNEATCVVGIAKSRYHNAPAIPVMRGTSREPVFVSAAGLDEHTAAVHVAHMHGPYRIPTLIRRVDYLSRRGLAASS
jgi:deoxyribonuclease V